jgi:hypothetical protein
MHQLEFNLVSVTRSRARDRESTDEEWNGEEGSGDHRPGSCSSDPDTDASHTHDRPCAEAPSTRSMSNGDHADEGARRTIGSAEFKGLHGHNESLDRLDVGIARRTRHRPSGNGGQTRSGTTFELTVSSPNASHSVGHREPGFCIGNGSIGVATNDMFNSDLARPRQSVESTALGQVGVKSFERECITDAGGINTHLGRCLDERFTRHPNLADHGFGFVDDALSCGEIVRTAQHATRIVGIEWRLHKLHRNRGES